MKRGRRASRLFTEIAETDQQQPQELSLAPPTLPLPQPQPQPLPQNSSRMISRMITQEQLLLLKHTIGLPPFSDSASILCEEIKIGA